MQVFTAIGNFFCQAIGLVLPVFAKAGDFRRWNPWVWRVLHLLILAAILLGMWWLNRYYQLSHFLQAVPPEYRQFFLPVLFLLLYGLSWIGYWLWRLLGEETAAAEFPDVDLPGRRPHRSWTRPGFRSPMHRCSWFWAGLPQATTH